MSDEDERQREVAEAEARSASEPEDRETVVPTDPIAFDEAFEEVIPRREALAVEPTPPQAPFPRPPAGAAARATIELDEMLATPTPSAVLGPALIVAGALLWAFVVMGTFTTSWLSGGGAPLSQGVAVTLVAATTLVAWWVVVRRSQAIPIQGVRSPFGRFVVIGIVAFALWVAALLVASVIGKASGANVDALMAAALLITSALAVVMGDRMIGRSRLPRSSGRRALVLAALFWVGMITLGACVELVAEY